MALSRPLPRHIQISETLIREIASGLLPDGSRLPPERLLANQHGVAVGTLRKALAILEEKRLLERRQGSGNYVRRRGGVKSVYSQFRLERPQGGGLPTADILSLQTAAPPEAAIAFGLPHACLLIERQRRLDNVPIAHERIWVAKPAMDLSIMDLSESLYAWYKDALGIVISRVEDKVSVAPLPTNTSLSWLSDGQAVGFVARKAWDQSGDPAEYSQSWFDPARACFFSREEGVTP